jgi:ribonuclease HII
MPDFVLESECWSRGVRFVAGVDEAGRGCLAGPVVAAAVVLAADARLDGLDDSKLLSPEARERLLTEIRSQAIAVGIGQCSPEEIDRLNILWASMEAMRRALMDLAVPAQEALVDGQFEIRGAPCPQRAVVRGDGISASIAAASIVAKVTRDRLMADLDAEYPVYGFPSHKGYATLAHYSALALHGPSPIHRRSFRLRPG